MSDTFDTPTFKFPYTNHARVTVTPFPDEATLLYQVVLGEPERRKRKKEEKRFVLSLTVQCLALMSGQTILFAENGEFPKYLGESSRILEFPRVPRV